MFSYQNKVVAIKITGQAGSDSFDLLINSGFVGQITGTNQGDGAYLIGSANNSFVLNNEEYVYPSGYPQSIIVDFADVYLNGYQDATGVVIYNSGDPLSGNYIIDTTPGNVILTHLSGGEWLLLNEDGDYIPNNVPSYDPSNPYGTYYDWYRGANVDVYRNPSAASNKIDLYHFSDLNLNEGQNELCFINSLNNGSGNKIFYEVGLYELSGSFLVSPSIIQTGEIIPAIGDSECLFFDLAYPTGTGIPTFEFDPTFEVDTGNLNQIFTGSGIHLQKDVTFFFNILDQQLNTISSNQQFLDNPLVSGCVFDVLNIDGTTAVENFFTGKYSRSVTVSALDNENIFGSYQKDFGVRCKLPNTFDGSVFTGEFFAYGNIPHILDISPNYTEFSGARQATESFNASIVLQNDLRFIQMDRYDIYALTTSGSAVNELTFLNPTAEEGYLSSQSAVNVSDVYSLTINKGSLIENTPYYFTVVPYGVLGSGAPFVFGPTTFVAKQTNIVLSESDVSALNIYDGSDFSRTLYKTGIFTRDENILHRFSSQDFSSVKYFVELSDNYGGTYTCELAGSISYGTPFLVTGMDLNFNNPYYALTGINSGTYGLYASGAAIAGFTYKLHATMI